MIDDALGISTSQDSGLLDSEGFSDFSVFAGITDVELILHDEARTRTYALLERLRSAGWRPLFHLDDPRLAPRERLAHVLNASSSIGLDPSHVPSVEEWMALPTRTRWRLHADHVYLDLRFDRDRTLTDPASPGAYLLTFQITS